MTSVSETRAATSVTGRVTIGPCQCHWPCHGSDPRAQGQLALGVDAVLLDNMTPEVAATAVRTIRTHSAQCWIEASGGITLANVRRYAETGVDTISVGALTHSAPSIDLALDVVTV